MKMTTDVYERFIRYVKIDTQSDKDSGLHPSTEKQKDLGRLLTEELKEMGAEDINYDGEHNYVYAKIPATDGGKDPCTLGFISHMDTAPDLSGRNVVPVLHENYDGGDIVLNSRDNVVLSPEVFPEMKNYIGKTLITTDGTTLLGADDKAGVAEIMAMSKILLEDAKSGEPEFIHGRIAVAFTPDEEIGEGVEFFDIKQFGADHAYTVDGGMIGELEYENFNAAQATVTFHGISVHPGEAKGKMKNASRIACEFQATLSPDEIPERTENYEGFIHLTSVKGDVEKAELVYIIRDHDAGLFERKKEKLAGIAERINEAYGSGTVETEIKDQYKNMKEKVADGYMFLVEEAAQAMEKLGIKPVIRPIRGGTDGAMLSCRGLVCPNLCTGGHNFHGRYEYICLQSMEKITELLTELACSVRKR